MPELFSRLAIDIGGTNIRFGLLSEDSLSPLHILQYKINDYPGLADVMRLYLDSAPANTAVQDVAVAVATPIEGDRIKLTNHDWNFQVSVIREQFGFRRLKVVNDFTALSLSLPLLGADELVQVGGGQPDPDGAIALLGAGTGLGVSGLIQTADGYYPLAGEGGHVSLGARSERELAIFSAFLDKYGHMSAERLLSGTGLTEFYQVIRRLDQLEANPLPNEEISRRAIKGSCASCAETMELFCEWLGIIGSNLALTLMASGGVYVGGGIVPKLGDYFLQSGFRRCFEAKGRFRKFMEQVPVYVIHADQPALRGAAHALEPRFAKLGVTCVAES
ncbi:MAG: glucokinase [Thiolinea sp.]